MQPWKNWLWKGTWLLFFLHWGYMTDGSVQKPHYVVSADSVILQPSYENSVNPFLSHIEQSSKLKPIKHKYSKKKMAQSAEAIGELPVDPSRPHFVESKEDDDAIDDNKAFGNGEKDLGDLFSVLFSGDY